MVNQAEETFEKAGALLKGHFLLASGRHSPAYWEKFRVLQHPEYTEKLCRLIADRFRKEGIQVVAGPTTGGIILAFEVARQLRARSIFAETEDSGKRTFRRGFHIDPGERVLIVDDVLTSGKSVREVIKAVDKTGGKLIGIGVLVDRAEENMDFGVPLFSCLRSPAVTYPPEACPLCTEGVPLVKPGSRQSRPL